MFFKIKDVPINNDGNIKKHILVTSEPEKILEKKEPKILAKKNNRVTL
jgi:hypothetical protein